MKKMWFMAVLAMLVMALMAPAAFAQDMDDDDGDFDNDDGVVDNDDDDGVAQPLPDTGGAEMAGGTTGPFYATLIGGLALVAFSTVLVVGYVTRRASGSPSRRL